MKSEEDKRKIFGEYFFDCPEEFEFMPGHVDLLLDIGRKLKDVKKAIAPCRLFASTAAGGTSRGTSGTSKRQADRLESSTDKVNRKSHALQYINVFGNLPCETYNDGYELETRYSNRRVKKRDSEKYVLRRHFHACVTQNFDHALSLRRLDVEITRKSKFCITETSIRHEFWRSVDVEENFLTG